MIKGDRWLRAAWQRPNNSNATAGNRQAVAGEQTQVRRHGEMWDRRAGHARAAALGLRQKRKDRQGTKGIGGAIGFTGGRKRRLQGAEASHGSRGINFTLGVATGRGSPGTHTVSGDAPAPSATVPAATPIADSLLRLVVET